MSKNLPPSVKRQVERQEQQELLDPVDTQKNEHSLRDTMHRRQVETSYMRAQQHREDND